MTVPALPIITDPLPADGINYLWDFSFKFHSKAHVRLYVYDPADVETIVTDTLYTVSVPGLGGTVTYPIAPATALPVGYHVRIERVVPETQPNRIGNTGAFLPQTHEDTFDLLAMQIQGVRARLDRTFYLPDYPDPEITDFKLPFPAVGHALVWGVEGFENSALSIEEITTLAENIEAAAATALGFAAIAVNAVAVVEEIAALAASGGVVDQAALITYAGNFAAVNVSAALDEASDAIDAAEADVTTLEGQVAALEAAVTALQSAGISVPIGSFMGWVGGVVPNGWALMYGQTVGNAASGAVLAGAGYATLFTHLGAWFPNTNLEVFANGETRVLPDLRGRAVIGKDNMGGVAAGRVTNAGAGNPGILATTRGAVGGVDRRAMTAAQLPNHGHQYRAISTDDIGGTLGIGGIVVSDGVRANFPAYTGALGDAPGEQISGQGGTFGEAYPNMQPSAVADWIIYTGVLV